MRRIATGAVIALVWWVSLAAPAVASEATESPVVGLTVTHQMWDPDRPWAKQNPKTRNVVGVIVEGPFILTTAEMIADATLIQVEKNGLSTRASARPYLVDPEINLALLKVDSTGFFDDLQPALLARETPTRGVLRTVRWKGQQLESLASRVKRFEVQAAHLGYLMHVFLLAQTDLSGGGWAEPVFNNDGHLVGITASQNKKQQVRIIPVEIIAKFLERATAPGPYRGFPVFGALWQVHANPDLAAYLGQADKLQGVLIRQIPWGGSACGVIKPLDILLSIDGKSIDAKGFYRHPQLGQLDFTYILVDEHEVGDKVFVKVIRDGRELDLKMTLRSYPVSLTLIPKRHGEEPPPYLVAGGLVLRELDRDYLLTWGSDWSEDAPLHLRTRYFQQKQAQRPDRRRVVLLTSVLPSPYNLGYQDLTDFVVESINGKRIGSIPAAVQAFENPVEGFHTVVLERNSARREIVLEANGFEAANAEILEHYRIPQASRLPSSVLPDGGPDCPGDF